MASSSLISGSLSLLFSLLLCLGLAGLALAGLHPDIGDGYQGESISTNTDQEHDSQTEYQNTSQDLIYLRFHSRTVDVVAAIH